MTITPATKAHIHPLCAIERACFPDPWGIPMLTRKLCDPAALCYVATEGGEVLGYAILQQTPPEAELFRIATDASARGQGIGRLLLDELLTRAEKNAITDVFLEVRASNAAAIALYTRCGFLPVGRRASYYNDPPEDAILMKRQGAV